MNKIPKVEALLKLSGMSSEIAEHLLVLCGFAITVWAIIRS
ncbi:hypothetical protein HanRHA438_Chr14g0656701 [Helianthus annuus]|nr:hypothetical protein HanRHA438_Chr14g0656701 [Helianthus annuus]